MYKAKYLLFSAAISIAMLTIMASCQRQVEPEKITLPPTSVLSIRSSWAVVKSPFLRVREEPFADAKILTHVRRGAVLEIISRTEKKETVENDSSYWYNINYEGLRGWVFGSYIEVLDSRSKAREYSAGLE
ncbi:MAG TPA: SH3 domain-containing protein [Spirochaetales bacterium]|nr:SH3 domain-containing protein [Spirochaetales bacterium]